MSERMCVSIQIRFFHILITTGMNYSEATLEGLVHYSRRGGAGWLAGWREVMETNNLHDGLIKERCRNYTFSGECKFRSDNNLISRGNA